MYNINCAGIHTHTHTHNMTDVRAGQQRRLSAEKLILSNSGAGEDSWESLGKQGDQTRPREMLWGGRWEGGSCLGMHVRIKDFKILKIKN